jgi:peptide/nickel transport system substrate-binding protein
MERLVVTTVPEPQARLAGLKTGAIHVAEPPLDDVPALREANEFQIVVAENTGQNVFWEFAAHRPPFNDKRARQAIAHATDPAAAIDLVYGGLSQQERCPISRGVFGNDQEFCAAHGHAYDPEKAAELLAELGYGTDNPLQVTMIGWTGGKRDKLMEVFQSQLAEVGVEAKIEIMDIGTMNARVRQENEKKEGVGTFDMMTWSWYDPDILSRPRRPRCYPAWLRPQGCRGRGAARRDPAAPPIGRARRRGGARRHAPRRPCRRGRADRRRGAGDARRPVAAGPGRPGRPGAD